MASANLQQTQMCPGCGNPMKVKLLDHTVTVGERKVTETTPGRYCDDCRENFLASLNAESVPAVRL